MGDVLVMHNKASYKYIEEDRAQSKRSYDDGYADYKARKAAAKVAPYRFVARFDFLIHY